MTRLGDVVETVVDCEHKTAPIDPDGDYFAVGTPAMSGFVIDYGEARRISRQTFESWTRRLTPRRGDLLLAREAPVGPVVMIPDSENVAPGQRTVLLRPQPRTVNSTFLYYALKAPVTQRALRERAAGSTVAHLNVADLRDFVFPFPFPSMETQDSVTEVLGILDDRISANNRAVEILDELASSLVAQLTLDASVRCLAEFASVTMGTSPKGESMNEVGLGVPFFQGTRDFGVRTPNCRVFTTAPTRMANFGDVLLSVRAPVGSINRAQEECCIGRGLASITVPHGGNAVLLHVLQQASRQWEPYESTGTVFGSIGRKDLEMIEVPWPDSDELVRLTPVIDALENRLMAADRESRTLAALRDTLLPALVSGRLSVRDAEAAVSEVV